MIIISKFYEAIIQFKQDKYTTVQINPLPKGNVKAILYGRKNNILWLYKEHNEHLNWTDLGIIVSSDSFEVILIKEAVND